MRSPLLAAALYTVRVEATVQILRHRGRPDRTVDPGQISHHRIGPIRSLPVNHLDRVGPRSKQAESGAPASIDNRAEGRFTGSRQQELGVWKRTAHFPIRATPEDVLLPGRFIILPQAEAEDMPPALLRVKGEITDLQGTLDPVRRAVRHIEPVTLFSNKLELPDAPRWQFARGNRNLVEGQIRIIQRLQLPSTFSNGLLPVIEIARQVNPRVPRTQLRIPLGLDPENPAPPAPEIAAVPARLFRRQRRHRFQRTAIRAEANRKLRPAARIPVRRQDDQPGAGGLPEDMDNFGKGFHSAVVHVDGGTLRAQH